MKCYINIVIISGSLIFVNCVDSEYNKANTDDNAVFMNEYDKEIAVETNEMVQDQSKTPEAVMSNFKAKYPGENDPDWKLDDHGNWESNFKIDGVSYRADYSPNGNWIETETSIDKSDLPKAIKYIIKSSYGDQEITEIERVDHHAKGIFYDVEFKKKGKNMDVEFKENGEIIN